MIATNAFKQAVSGTYTNSDTVIELNSISNTIGNADYLPNGGFNLILYDGLFGNPADANNAGKYEILECSSVNYATNEITVVRARENTTAVTIDASSWQVVYGATVAFFAQFEDADATILKEADVVDTLVSTSITAPLSANQGKVLQDGKEPADATILKEADVVDNLTSTSTTDPLSANQGKQLEDTKIATSAIVNDLTTGGTTVPLSAEQGKVLQDGKVAKAGDTMTGLLRATAGINFNASAGDTLSDYEVGTWTPVYTSSEGDFTSVPQGTLVNGRYVKIGPLVVVSCFYRTSGLNKGAISPSAGVGIKGLPFTIGSTLGSRGGGIITQSFSFTSNFPTNTLGIQNTTLLQLQLDDFNPLLVSNLGTGTNNNGITLIHTYLT